MFPQHLPVFDVENPTNPGLYHDMGPVHGMPLDWRQDQTGTMPAAVQAYYDKSMTPEQLILVIAYIRHHIHAPCWTSIKDIDEELTSFILELRRLSLELKTSEDISEYIAKALDWALDPL